MPLARADQVIEEGCCLLHCMSPLLCRFSAAGMTSYRRAEGAGGRKAPRHEVAGRWVRLGSERYGDLMLMPSSMVEVRLAGCDLHVCRQARSGACNVHLECASRRALGAHQRALGASIDVIGSREMITGVELAHRSEKVATLTVDLAHDVSILPGVGRHFG